MGTSLTQTDEVSNYPIVSALESKHLNNKSSPEEYYFMLPSNFAEYLKW